MFPSPLPYSIPPCTISPPEKSNTIEACYNRIISHQQVRPLRLHDDPARRRADDGRHGTAGRRQEPDHAALPAPLQHHHHQLVQRQDALHHLHQDPGVAVLAQVSARCFNGNIFQT